MTQTSTTIRVSTEQRDRLRRLAQERSATMTDTFDAALEALRRDQFYRDMADAQERLGSRPDDLAAYEAERNAWLDADLR